MEDPILSPIVQIFQKIVDKLNANFHYLNYFTKDLHKCDRLRSIKLVILLEKSARSTSHSIFSGLI